MIISIDAEKAFDKIQQPFMLKTLNKLGMFVAALFTIAKTWNQPKCPSVIDWTKKMWHIYTMEY